VQVLSGHGTKTNSRCSSQTRGPMSDQLLAFADGWGAEGEEVERAEEREEEGGGPSRPFRTFQQADRQLMGLEQEDGDLECLVGLLVARLASSASVAKCPG